MSKKELKYQLNNENKSVKQLEKGHELLRLEVAYLKKVKAYREDPEGFIEKHNQQYHSNTKKVSD